MNSIRWFMIKKWWSIYLKWFLRRLKDRSGFKNNDKIRCTNKNKFRSKQDQKKITKKKDNGE
jgi:hypothetical protein